MQQTANRSSSLLRALWGVMLIIHFHLRLLMRRATIEVLMPPPVIAAKSIVVAGTANYECHVSWQYRVRATLSQVLEMTIVAERIKVIFEEAVYANPDATYIHLNKDTLIASLTRASGSASAKKRDAQRCRSAIHHLESLNLLELHTDTGNLHLMQSKWIAPFTAVNVLAESRRGCAGHTMDMAHAAALLSGMRAA